MQIKHFVAAYALIASALVCGTITAQAQNGQGQNGQGQNGQGQNGQAGQARKVFVVAMENHNWTQPDPNADPQQIFLNPAAPFINSLVNGNSGISAQVAYATNYINAGIDLGLSVHPSEPNYIWAEAGTNFGVMNDHDPYKKITCLDDTIQNTNQHLSAFLTKAGKTWRSYQEDVNVDLTTNLPLTMASWTVPLFRFSGNFSSGINAYNYTTQYDYAPKHNPMVFFKDTAGPCPAVHSTQYPPLQQLAIDLQNNSLADYTWITPNQFNDQHSSLDLGYGVFPNGDQASIAQGDNFLARIVPLIMASDAYANGGVIVLWWDESEHGSTPQQTLPFMIISKDAHKNVGGKPYASSVQFSHSSFLRTMQEIFDVDPLSGYPWLGDAAVANDLSDLFKPGAIQ
jgi:hypothetical protein